MHKDGGEVGGGYCRAISIVLVENPNGLRGKKPSHSFCFSLKGVKMLSGLQQVEESIVGVPFIIFLVFVHLLQMMHLADHTTL